MKIALINPVNSLNVIRAPNLPKSLLNLLSSFKLSARGVFPPLNLAVVAALTPPDIEVRVIDECVEPVDFEGSYDLVGITAITTSALRAYEIAARFREKGTPVVMGGIHASMLPEEALEHADTVAVGEAENIWPRLIEDFKEGRMGRLYRAEALPSLDMVPIPRRDLLKSKDYMVFNTVQTARGCPHDCSFCTVTIFSGSRLRLRPVEKVVEELRGLKGKKVFFVDDNIAGDRRRAKELFRAIAPLKLGWGAQATVDVARDEELLRLMRWSGCHMLFVGFESFSQESLREAHKLVNKVDYYREAMERFHRHKIAVWGGLIFGFDQDRESIFEETMKFVGETGMEFAQFAYLTPLPGTALFQQLEKEQRLLTRDWSMYDMGNIVHRPARLSLAALERGQNNAWRTFYGLFSIAKRLGMVRSRRSLAYWALNLAIRRYVHKFFQAKDGWEYCEDEGLESSSVTDVAQKSF